MAIRKLKPPPSLFVRTHWGIKTATAVFLFLGAMGTAAATWQKFDWWIPASIQYVHRLVNPTSSRLIDLQIEQAEGKRDQIEEAIFKWTDQIAKESDDRKRAEYRERVRDLTNTKRKLDGQIKTLNKMRGEE